MICPDCVHEDRQTCPTTALRSMMEDHGDWPCAYGRKRNYEEELERLSLKMELNDMEYRPDRVDDRKSHVKYKW